MVFVNSMSDLFHERIPLNFIRKVFTSMEDNPQHTFQVLTKRPERVLELADSLPWPGNVWMGVSVENRQFVQRADVLREIHPAVRFISAEPLLGPLKNLNLKGIDWLIAGGESGFRHRPVKADWIRELRDRCAREEVAFFFKQWGGRTSKAGGRKLDGLTYDDMPTPRRPGLAVA
jgi:protein gp37